mmetsp:Transcript_54207/g.90348  ORF Transcript_54207/g.90348 Transcript_54207/m.90348 type:complete len:277 (+) Transcript_54207:371-1201(+)
MDAYTTVGPRGLAALLSSVLSIGTWGREGEARQWILIPERCHGCFRVPSPTEIRSNAVISWSCQIGKRMGPWRLDHGSHGSHTERRQASGKRLRCIAETVRRDTARSCPEMQKLLWAFGQFMRGKLFCVVFRRAAGDGDVVQLFGFQPRQLEDLLGPPFLHCLKRLAIVLTHTDGVEKFAGSRRLLPLQHCGLGGDVRHLHLLGILWQLPGLTERWGRFHVPEHTRCEVVLTRCRGLGWGDVVVRCLSLLFLSTLLGSQHCLPRSVCTPQLRNGFH